MAEKNNSKAPKRRRKRSVLFAPLSFLVILAAMIFGLSVFFRASKIEVTGVSLYTPEEIIEAAGIEEGDNLFFINRFSTVSKIYTKLPYVEYVTLTRKLPNKLIIEVQESSGMAFVTLDGTFYLLDRGCKVLGSVTLADVGGLIQVEGITPVSVAVGEKLRIEAQETGAVDYLANVLTAISERGIQRDVTRIDLSNVTNLTFDYLQRFTVKFGKNEDVEYKFNALASTVAQLSDGDFGTIDLSVEKKASFRPG